MKKFLCIAATVAVAATCCIIGGCGGEAAVEYKLSGDGTHYIVSAVTGNKRALKSYEIPSVYAEEEGDELLPVTEIGESAFYQCSALSEIVIPDTVTSIGNLAFALSGLSDVTIPASVTSIGYSAFGMCTALKKVVIPASVTSLGDRAFVNCTHLERAEVYAQITDLRFRTFYNSVVTSAGNVYTETALTEIVLSASITKIAESALYGNAITDIYFMGTEEQWEELYFYEYEENDDGEEVEVPLEKSECLPSSTTIHYNYDPSV